MQTKATTQTPPEGALSTANAGDFLRWTLAAVALALCTHLAWNAFAAPPLFAEEALLWLRGDGIARLSTDLFGATPFALRLPAALLHAMTALLIFACGTRLFGGDEGARIGFWAAICWTASLGVAVSSGVYSSDGIVGAVWAAALFCAISALTRRGILWWVPAICAGQLLGLRAISVSELGAAEIDLSGTAGFFGTHFFATGPILVVLALLAFVRRKSWIDDPRMAALGGLMFATLVAATAAIAVIPSLGLRWSVPSALLTCLFVAALCVRSGKPRRLAVAVALSLGLWAAFWSVAALYNGRHQILPAIADPFAETRAAPLICPEAVAAVRRGDAIALIGPDRGLLALCAFEGKLPASRVVNEAAAPRDTASTYVWIARGAAARPEGWAETRALKMAEATLYRDQQVAAPIYLVTGAAQ